MMQITFSFFKQIRKSKLGSINIAPILNNDAYYIYILKQSRNVDIG